MRRRVRASARESSTVVGLAAMRGQYHHDAAQIEAPRNPAVPVELPSVAVFRRVRHRAEIRRRGRGPRASIAVPKSGGQSASAAIGPVGVNDSQADLAIGRRPRSARRGTRRLRRTWSLLRDGPLQFDIRKTGECGVPLLANLDDGGLSVSANRRDDLGGGAGQHCDAGVRRDVGGVEDDPDAISTLDRDEVDDTRAVHEQAHEIPDGSARNQSERHWRAVVETREVLGYRNDQGDRREGERETQFPRVVADSEPERALVAVYDAEPDGARDSRLERPDPEDGELLGHEVADGDQRGDTGEWYQRRTACWFVHRFPITGSCGRRGRGAPLMPGSAANKPR